MEGLPDVFVCGQNLFGQFREPGEEKGLQRLNWEQFGFKTDSRISKFDINVTVNYSAIVVNDAVTISTTDVTKMLERDASGFVLRTFHFPHEVRKISSNSKFCLVLLENGSLHKIHIQVPHSEEVVNFLLVQKPKSVLVTNRTPEMITDISCGENFVVATTNHNAVYNPPEKVHEFQSYEKIKKVCCGIEHAVLLTQSGDVYSWGVGLRGQLGHAVISNEPKPELVEALAGIKIVDIAAGGWHSAAVSSWNDLYTWGWNSHGQLGLKFYSLNDPTSKSLLRLKNQTVYLAPTLVDVGDSVEVARVFCGSKHTVILSTDDRIFVTGSNNWGQLGMSSKDREFHRGKVKNNAFLDEFQELKLGLDFSEFHCYAGSACTAFVENKS